MKLRVFDFGCDIGIDIAPDVEELQKGRSSLECVGRLSDSPSVPYLMD